MIFAIFHLHSAVYAVAAAFGTVLKIVQLDLLEQLMKLKMKKTANTFMHVLKAWCAACVCVRAREFAFSS